MNVLGVSSFFHDAAACLVMDGEPLVAIEEERLSRRKHDRALPVRAMNYCLEYAGIDAGAIDAVCYYEKPLRKLERVLQTAKQVGRRGFGFAREQVQALGREGLSFESQLKQRIGYEGKVWYLEHHLSHAASAYYPSPFREATILTVDGVGEQATTGIFTGRNGLITPRMELRYPHSLGLLYSAVTAFLGFAVNNDEYKVMGLAAYGKPIYIDELSKIIRIKTDGSFALDMKYFSFNYDRQSMYTQDFCDLFGEARVPGMPVEQRDRDLASSIQAICERVYLGLATKAKELDPSMQNLCLAGGVALNGVANHKVAKESGFENVFIQPAAGDGGGAMGAALWGSHRLGDGPRKVRRHSSWLGKPYSRSEVESALSICNLEYEMLDETTLCQKVAELLADGKIVAWHQGRSEFGPRALGSRSILADPRRSEMQQVLNARIKFREEFRPFAPAVLADWAGEWFELSEESPFMLRVCPVIEAKRASVPAITHVDGSARPQTVAKSDIPLFYQLISEFNKLTGVPMVINTSFNVRGEPIVETPLDACRCFMDTDIDFLAINGYLATKLI